MREILDKERDLINYLLENLNPKHTVRTPERCRTMNDGAMGSISFDLSNSAKYGSDLVQVKYLDADNVPVYITLTTDKEGNLFELDFWKVDFSKLIKYPEPGEITKTTTNNI